MILWAGVLLWGCSDGGGRRGGARRGRRGGADTGWCQGRAPPQAGHSCLGPQHRQGTGESRISRQEGLPEACGGRAHHQGKGADGRRSTLSGGGARRGRTPIVGGSRGGAVTRYNRTVRGGGAGGAARSVRRSGKNYARIHAVRVRCAIRERPADWEERRQVLFTFEQFHPRKWSIRGSEVHEFDVGQVKVRTTTRAVQILPPPALYGTVMSGKDAVLACVDQAMPVIEQVFGIRLERPRAVSIQVSHQHVALLDNDLAALFWPMELRVVDERGKLRAWTDASHGRPELEFGEEGLQEEDAEIWQELILDALQRPHFRLSELTQLVQDGHVLLHQMIGQQLSTAKKVDELASGMQLMLQLWAMDRGMQPDMLLQAMRSGQMPPADKKEVPERPDYVG